MRQSGPQCDPVSGLELNVPVYVAGMKGGKGASGSGTSPGGK